ncbi:IS5 family transposase [Streptomyces sp. NK08204]|uniref:IS5 family transposase n=1 Tax=Streptomyces sp. NK08204 TaxID=2873260 RepID=UPI0035A98C95
MMDAVFYLLDGGIKWRAMPADFPPWDRVYAFWRRFRDRGWIAELHDRLRGAVREAAWRDPEPTAGIIDSPTVRSTPTVPGTTSGYDGGKRTVGRKRHLVCDVLGLVLAVLVTPADAGDRSAGQELLAKVAARHHRHQADLGRCRLHRLPGRLVHHRAGTGAADRQAQRRRERVSVLPRRWIIERTNAWICRTRRLDRDYERRCDSSEAMIYWSMVMLMTRRLARRPA